MYSCNLLYCLFVVSRFANQVSLPQHPARSQSDVASSEVERSGDQDGRNRGLPPRLKEYAVCFIEEAATAVSRWPDLTKPGYQALGRIMQEDEGLHCPFVTQKFQIGRTKCCSLFSRMAGAFSFAHHVSFLQRKCVEWKSMAMFLEPRGNGTCSSPRGSLRKCNLPNDLERRETRFVN